MPIIGREVLSDAVKALGIGDDDGGAHHFLAVLAPSNNSGVLGAAHVALNEDGAVTVDLVAQGLTPGVEHPAHIHGFRDGSPSELPTIALDADRDGFVERPTTSWRCSPSSRRVATF